MILLSQSAFVFTGAGDGEADVSVAGGEYLPTGICCLSFSIDCWFSVPFVSARSYSADLSSATFPSRLQEIKKLKIKSAAIKIFDFITMSLD